MSGALRSWAGRIVVCAGLIATAGLIFFPQDVSASMATNSAINGGNAWNFCHDPAHNNGPGYFALGAVWLSNDSVDYYSEKVTVPLNAGSKVRVSIRGAVNSCETTFSQTRRMFAVDVSTSFLSGLGGNQFSRGDMSPGVRYSWTTSGSHLYGDLDVSKVALCSASSLATGKSTGYIDVSITRRQQQRHPSTGYVYFDSPTFGTETVRVHVERACPTYNFNLTPTITSVVDGTRLDSNSGPLTVTGRVNNSGTSSSTSGVKWQLTRVKYDPGVAIANKGGGTHATNNPCAYFTGNQGCAAASGGSGTTTYGTGPTNHSINDSIGSLPVGTRICYALSVSPYSQSNSHWRHSALYCYVIAKSPKVQILGGDLIVGRGVSTPKSVVTSISINHSNNRLYGSWVEYGLLSTGPVSGMDSGSGLAGGSLNSGGSCKITGLLTFSNASSATCAFGNYAMSGASPSLKDRFPVDATDPSAKINSASVSIGSLAKRKVYGVSGENLTISGGNLAASTSGTSRGEWVVINAPDTNVTITGNLTYSVGGGGMKSISHIPQLIIIAKNISIAENVTRVDSWLVASEYVNTCSAVAAGSLPTSKGVTSTALNANICNKQLTVNGPVIGQKMYLYRTANAGSGADAGVPAELFNSRPDAYLWALSHVSGSSRITTAATRELPPRF